MGEKHQSRKKSSVSTRQHKKDGNGNSRSAKYENAKNNPKTVKPVSYLKKKCRNRIHIIKYRNIYTKKNANTCTE